MLISVFLLVLRLSASKIGGQVSEVYISDIFLSDTERDVGYVSED
jgi:hypothetical protein